MNNFGEIFGMLIHSSEVAIEPLLFSILQKNRDDSRERVCGSGSKFPLLLPVVFRLYYSTFETGGDDLED
jgi:hypothetical protein